MTIEDLKRLFPDMLADGRVNERQFYLAKCPCHPDKYRSLRIAAKENQDGQIIGLALSCQSGCSAKEVVEAAGLPPAEEMIEKTDIAVRETQAVAARDAAADAVKEMAAALGGQIGALAEMLRVTNERMAEMEKVIRTLEKVTPRQAGNVNRAIRERAAEICREYRMGVTITPVEPGRGQAPEKARFEPDKEKAKAVGTAIRRDVRAATGARSMQAVARCDYSTVIGMIMDWDEYETIQGIRKKGVGK